MAIAASILVAACIGGWFLLQRHEGQVAQTALLDLSNRSLPRGTEPNPPEPPLVVNRAARHWNIYLPLGSTEGTYEIRIVTDSGGLVLTATGQATLMSGVASLPVDVNLGSKNLGRCNLEILKNTGEWNSFPLILR
jgi:hypothetical protein